jgi:hypothetical protein
MYAVTDLNYIRKQVKNYTGNWSSKEKQPGTAHSRASGIEERTRTMLQMTIEE